MEFFDSQVMQRFAHQIQLAATGATGAHFEPRIGLCGDLRLAEVLQWQGHAGTELCNADARELCPRCFTDLGHFPVSPGNRRVERPIHRDSAVRQGFQGRGGFQRDRLTPLVHRSPTDLESRSDSCLATEMTNGIDFTHGADVNRCLRRHATSVYGSAVNLSKQMGTQHERIEQMFAATGKDWPDVVAATGVSRAGKKKWADGDFKSITVEHLFKMADLFGCDARWLGTGEGTPFPERDPWTIELLAAWNNVNQEGRVNMVEHARYVVGQPRFRQSADPSNDSAASTHK